MILPIYVYGNPVLRKKSIDISSDYPDLKNLINNMFETMYNSKGVGLAAPQIGKNINLIVVDASAYDKNDPEIRDFKRVIINPKIHFNSEKKITVEEGCLSIPDIHEDVNRYEDITVEYLNENFEYVKENIKSYPAVILQHEYDHLQGIVFVDKISPIRKRFITNRLSNISKGKSIPNYKIVL